MAEARQEIYKLMERVGAPRVTARCPYARAPCVPQDSFPRFKMSKEFLTCVEQ